MVTIEMEMPRSCSQCRFEGRYDPGYGGFECFALMDVVKVDWHTRERDARCPLRGEKNEVHH